MLLLHALVLLAPLLSLPQELSGVESVEMEAQEGTLRYAFRLDAPGSDAGDPGVTPVGYALVSAAELRDGSTRRSIEISLGEAGSRVVHVEKISATERTLIWRELGRSGGRSLFLGAGALRVLVRDFAVPGAHRETLAVGALDRLPLELVHAALAAERGFPADVFDPLSRTWRRVQTSVTRQAVPGGITLAQVRLIDEDGRDTSWLFAGCEPLAFELSPGGFRATRVPLAAYATAETSH